MRTVIACLICIVISSVVWSAPLPEGMVDNDYPPITYSPGWSSNSNAVAFGGTYQTTSDYSATVTFDTYATGLTIYFVYESGADEMDICIDDACETVDTDGSTARGDHEITGLSDSQKTVTIRKLTDDSAVIHFDAIYIHPSQEVQATPAPNLIYTEYEVGLDTYTGVLDVRVTSGDVAIFIILTIMAVMQIVSFIQHTLVGDQITSILRRILNR